MYLKQINDFGIISVHNLSHILKVTFILIYLNCIKIILYILRFHKKLCALFSELLKIIKKFSQLLSELKTEGNS